MQSDENNSQSTIKSYRLTRSERIQWLACLVVVNGGFIFALLVGVSFVEWRVKLPVFLFAVATGIVCSVVRIGHFIAEDTMRIEICITENGVLKKYRSGKIETLEWHELIAVRGAIEPGRSFASRMFRIFRALAWIPEPLRLRKRDGTEFKLDFIPTFISDRLLAPIVFASPPNSLLRTALISHIQEEKRDSEIGFATLARYLLLIPLVLIPVAVLGLVQHWWVVRETIILAVFGVVFPTMLFGLALADGWIRAWVRRKFMRTKKSVPVIKSDSDK